MDFVDVSYIKKESILSIVACVSIDWGGYECEWMGVIYIFMGRMEGWRALMCLRETNNLSLAINFLRTL